MQLAVFFGVYTVLCFGDMIVYNRRKRTEFYAVMEKLRSDEYTKALEAESRGKATDDDMLLINQERSRYQQMLMDQEKAEKGVWKRMKESVVGTEEYEEKKGGKLGLGGRKKENVTDAVGDMLEKRDDKLRVTAAASKVANTANGLVRTGGPLDQMAQQTADSVTKRTKSWTDWASRR